MKYLLFLILISTVLACQDVKRPEKPKDLIPQGKMVDVLTEAYLISAARNYDNRVIRSKGIKLDSFMYGKYNIDSMQFARSNAYYTSDLNAYNDLFKKVEEKLLKLQIKVDSIAADIKSQKEEQRKLDSISGRAYDTLIMPVDSIFRPRSLDSILRKKPLIDPEETQLP